MLESYKWMDGMGWMGWKSLKALILRAQLCGANKHSASSCATINEGEKYGNYEIETDGEGKSRHT